MTDLAPTPLSAEYYVYGIPLRFAFWVTYPNMSTYPLLGVDILSMHTQKVDFS